MRICLKNRAALARMTDEEFNHHSHLAKHKSLNYHSQPELATSHKDSKEDGRANPMTKMDDKVKDIGIIEALSPIHEGKIVKSEINRSKAGKILRGGSRYKDTREEYRIVEGERLKSIGESSGYNTTATTATTTTTRTKKKEESKTVKNKLLRKYMENDCPFPKESQLREKQYETARTYKKLSTSRYSFLDILNQSGAGIGASPYYIPQKYSDTSIKAFATSIDYGATGASTDRSHYNRSNTNITSQPIILNSKIEEGGSQGNSNLNIFASFDGSIPWSTAATQPYSPRISSAICTRFSEIRQKRREYKLKKGGFFKMEDNQSSDNHLYKRDSGVGETTSNFIKYNTRTGGDKVLVSQNSFSTPKIVKGSHLLNEKILSKSSTIDTLLRNTALRIDNKETDNTELNTGLNLKFSSYSPAFVPALQIDNRKLSSPQQLLGKEAKRTPSRSPPTLSQISTARTASSSFNSRESSAEPEDIKRIYGEKGGRVRKDILLDNFRRIERIPKVERKDSTVLKVIVKEKGEEISKRIATPSPILEGTKSRQYEEEMEAKCKDNYKPMMKSSRSRSSTPVRISLNIDLEEMKRSANRNLGLELHEGGSWGRDPRGDRNSDLINQDKIKVFDEFTML